MYQKQHWDDGLTVLSAHHLEHIESGIADIHNAASNALKGTASGAAIRVDDVSPLEHSVPVRVRSKNLFNVKNFAVQKVSGSSPYITEVGENYIKITTNEGGNAVGYCGAGKKLSALCPGLQPGKQYVLNAKTDNADRKSFYLNSTKTGWKFGTPLTVTEEMLESGVAVYGLYESGAVCTISDIQIEEGTTATPYAPYVPDLTAVTVYGGGVNLYDDAAKTVGANIFSGKETADANTNLSDYFVVPPNATIQISLANRWAFYDAERNVLAYVTNSATVPRSVVVPSNACYMRLSYHTVVTPMNPTYTSNGSDIMAVVGKKLPAAYYPFTRGLSAYPTSGDGTCEVASIAPTMTLTTDNPNVVMECKYNRDINKAFEQLTQAILSMGGNI